MSRSQAAESKSSTLTIVAITEVIVVLFTLVSLN